MKCVFTVISSLFLMVGGAMAQDAESGRQLYELHCSTCHGLEARGNGPLAPALVLQPPSLRDLIQKYGRFPMKQVVMRIDGREPLVSHGSPMPIYGPFFDGHDASLKVETGQPIMTSRPIVDLITYLQKIQD